MYNRKIALTNKKSMANSKSFNKYTYNLGVRRFFVWIYVIYINSKSLLFPKRAKEIGTA